MIDAGDYRARAVSAKLGRAGTGTEQVGVEFELLDADIQGQKLTWFGYFTEKGTDIALRGLRTAGWRGDDLSDLSSLSGPNTPEVILVVTREEYNGSPKVKVAFINSLGGLAMRNALDDEEAKAFAERMKGKVLLFNQAQPAPKTQSRSSDNGPPLDHLEQQDPSQQSDEIPF